MSGDAERLDRNADGLAPPASTQWSGEESGEPEEGRPLPPFFAGDEDAAAPAAPAQAPGRDADELVQEEPESFPYEAVGGPAAPAPAAAAEDDDFPVEAFDVPELHRAPAGAAPAAAAGAEGEVAERLERFAARLREQGAAALTAEIQSADRFDALLAGMIAGYLAAQAD